MNSHVRELVKKAELIGWRHVGFDGNGHPRLQHETTGHKFSVPGTPSDWRSVNNTLRDLERICGRKLPRQNKGRASFTPVRSPMVTSRSSTEVAASENVARLIKAWHKLDQEINRLSAQQTRCAATKARVLVARRIDLEKRLAELHQPIPISQESA